MTMPWSVLAPNMRVTLLNLITAISFAVVHGWHVLLLPNTVHAPLRHFSRYYDGTAILSTPTPTFLFSTPFDDNSDDDTDDKNDSNEVTTKDSSTGESSSSSSSTLVEDADYASFQEIDFAAMDPLSDMDFEEYEKRYLTSPDTPQDELIWDDSIPTINQIYLVGRVGNTPEARYLPDNNLVVSLTVALPRYYNYWEREYLQIDYGQEETEWYNLECWGQLGEFVMKNVEKGTRVGVIGAIDQDYYPNKQTGKVSSNCKILVQDLDILESKVESESRKEHQRGPSLFTSDDDDDHDNDDYGPSPFPSGSSGGFFDPT
jgi:single-strand DNA-binding protein